MTQDRVPRIGTDRMLRAAPVLVAGTIALVYVLVSPASFDLAAHLTRAKLFKADGFGLWNNWWYGGHFTPGYSVLFPPIAAGLTPQVTGAIAATATAAVAEPLFHERFGRDGWVGATWFGLATTTNLFTGRLAFAAGLLPATAAVLALTRGRLGTAWAFGLLSALVSPVAALFAALVGASDAIATSAQTHIALRGAGIIARTRATIARGLPGLVLVLACLLPVALLTVAFPEGGSEPFAFATLLPIPVLCIVAFLFLPWPSPVLRTVTVLYLVGCIAAYAINSPIGGNAARLGPLVAGPLAAAVLWPWRKPLLALVAIPLIYIQWQAPFRDVTRSNGDRAVKAAYYEPLNAFLAVQPGPPFRVEIPFTKFHFEVYRVGPQFPLARGWERQLDIKDNALFYDGTLTAATYEHWLHTLAVRFVALPDTRFDYSATKEAALIQHGLPYLRLVFRSTHWRVYEVANATPVVSGAARLVSIGPSDLTLSVQHPGAASVRVRWSPYWMLRPAGGCVAPDGDFVRLQLARRGTVRLVQHFAFDRIRSRTPRCG